MSLLWKTAVMAAVKNPCDGAGHREHIPYSRQTKLNKGKINCPSCKREFEVRLSAPDKKNNAKHGTVPSHKIG